MGIDLSRFDHGAARLWSSVGTFLCSREVLGELGGPIYSAEGSSWFIAQDGPRVVGFCTLRDTPAAYWYDYAYVVPDSRRRGVFTALAAARAAYLRTLPKKPIRICCRETRWPYYDARGFSVASRRGSWVYGVTEAGPWT